MSERDERHPSTQSSQRSFPNRVFGQCTFSDSVVSRYPAWAVQGSNLRPPPCKRASGVLRSCVARSACAEIAAVSERLYVAVSARPCRLLRASRAENVRTDTAAAS
jgi:hypothetical protein